MRLLRGERSPQQASFVELFFDLVVVFALNQVVASSAPGLASASATDQWVTLLRVMLLILPLIWVWTMTAYGTARFDPRGNEAQVVVLVTAFGVLLLGAAIPEAFDATALAFAVIYVALQISRVAVLALTLRRHPLRRRYLATLFWFCISAVPWLLGAVTGGTAGTLLWLLAVTIEYGAARTGWPAPRLGRERITAWAHAPEHLADRYRQLLMIALGEAILAVGIAYTDQAGFRSLTQTFGLVIAFLTAVLLWRIYSYKAGDLFGVAIASAKDPARLGRVAAGAHVFMIVGVLATAAGHELVQTHPAGHSASAWLAVILGGPAIYLFGRALLERVVFSRMSRPRLIGIAVLLLLTVPLAFTPPLTAVAAASAALLAIAIADVHRAAGRPSEAPAPPG
ncbi:low temperature requirement protein A [Micromonospora halotolerans]|uniref:Low temperature requirement protein A n=1 Tax=Micromonospora halotolerans TaxID=709879 RepID=A0ABZ0A2X6_9ACTN|nr:low temperature requirement protein A [Micromonospora halotolerans]WNM41732.1 low temperature requirement protein A [Micromonospora halotolerans]